MSSSSRRRLLQVRPETLAAFLLVLAIGYGLGRGGFEPVAAVGAAGSIDVCPRSSPDTPGRREADRAGRSRCPAPHAPADCPQQHGAAGP